MQIHAVLTVGQRERERESAAADGARSSFWADLRAIGVCGNVPALEGGDSPRNEPIPLRVLPTVFCEPRDIPNPFLRRGVSSSGFGDLSENRVLDSSLQRLLGKAYTERCGEDISASVVGVSL